MSYGGEEGQRSRVVEVGAGLIAIVGLLSVGRVAYGVLVNLSQDWDGGARTVFLVLNAVVLVFALFTLSLAVPVWRGRLWGWVTALVLLPFILLAGGLLLLITVLSDQSPLIGAGIVTAALAALLTLSVPRAARGYFTRKQPAAHFQPGPYAPR